MSYIETIYEADSHLPPGAIGEISVLSVWWQHRFRRGHDKDGTHNDPLVPHAWAICELTGAGVTVIDSEGFTSLTRQGVGHVRLVLTNEMEQWQAVVWPIWVGDSGDPYYGYEAQDAGAVAKTATTVDIKIVSKDANATEVDFAVAVYGTRL